MYFHKRVKVVNRRRGVRLFHIVCLCTLLFQEFLHVFYLVSHDFRYVQQTYISCKTIVYLSITL